jgi:hypothetical protein
LAEKTVKAQMPGTFYRHPDPESDFYVDEGDTVSAGDTVGLMEVRSREFGEPWSGSAVGAGSRLRPRY